MSSLDVDIDKFAKKISTKYDQLTQNVLVEIADRLIKRTQVGNPELWSKPPGKNYVPGKARANWEHSTSTTSTEELDERDVDGDATLSKIKSSIPANAADHDHVIYNAAKHIWALENGHSTQAPSGMVALTLVEVPQIIDEEARKLK